MSGNLMDWYNEDKEQLAYKASGVEIFMFYVSMVFIILFGLFAWCKFQPKVLVCLIPLLIWMFLRSSRKNMTATANWVAGFFGAIGGAALVVLSNYKIFFK